MSTTNTQSPDFKGIKQGKVNQNQSQLKTIFDYLQKHIATASMISKETGIPQKSICRYKRDLEKNGLLYEVEKRFCKVTGFSAWYLTTNKSLFPKVKNTNSKF